MMGIFETVALALIAAASSVGVAPSAMLNSSGCLILLRSSLKNYIPRFSAS
jgi:hypothetical protein